MNDAGHRLKMIAGSGLAKGLDAADHKLVLRGRLIDHPHPSPLPGLDIAVLDEACQRAAQRGAGAGIRRRQFAFGGKDRLGGIEALLYFLLHVLVDALILRRRHSVHPFLSIHLSIKNTRRK